MSEFVQNAFIEMSRRFVFLRLQIAAQLSRARYLFALSYWKGRPRKKTRNGDDIVNLLWVLSLACN